MRERLHHSQQKQLTLNVLQWQKQVLCPQPECVLPRCEKPNQPVQHRKLEKQEEVSAKFRPLRAFAQEPDGRGQRPHPGLRREGRESPKLPKVSLEY